MSRLESFDSRSWKTCLFVLSLSFLISLPSFAEEEIDIEGVPQPVAERLSNLIALQFQAREEMARIEQAQGIAALYERIDKNKIQIEIAGVGTAKPTLINGIITIRVVPVDTEVTYVFADRVDAQEVSQHLYRQFIPRQHLFAGTDRDDGIDGRDVVVVWMDGDGADIETHPRAKRFGAQHWKEYFQAVAKAPTLGDALLGQMSGILQFGLGALAGGLKDYFDPGTEFFWDPAVMNYIWGATIGTFHRTYTNILYPFAKKTVRNQSMSALKASVASFSFAYTLIARTQGVGSLNPIGNPGAGATMFHFVNLTALWTHFHIWSNAFANNWAKNAVRQIVRVREEARVNTRDFVFRLFGREIRINQKGLEGQLISEPGPNVLKNADLLQIDVGGLPISKVILYSSVPFFEWLSHRYAIKNHPEIAKRMGIDKSPLIGWINGAKKVMKLPVSAVVNFRSNLVHIYQGMSTVAMDPFLTVRVLQQQIRQGNEARVRDQQNTQTEFQSLPRRIESHQLNGICQANFKTAG